MKIWQLLSSRKKWTRNTFARYANGHVCSIHSPTASRWCLSGAAHKCYPDINKMFNVIDKIDNEILKRIGSEARPPALSVIVYYNDNPKRKFSEIKTLVKKLDV